MITLRPYQSDAIAAVKDYWSKGGGNPLVEMATGTGKSMVIAELTRSLLEEYPAMRVLMLVHVRELVQQNFMALLKVWPDAPAGIYSAGLGRRDAHHRITFASIQSVYRRADLLGERDLIHIDEAHLVPSKGEGMYRQLLDDIAAKSPHARVCGFSATPYRMDTGRLDAGTSRLFDETVYTYGIARGIEDGFLSPLTSPLNSSLTEIDVSNVQRRGGEFVPAQLEQASDKITEQSVAELIERGKNRKSWMIYCAGVKHAYRVRDEIRKYGISCETITGDTPVGERDSILRRFKAGELRSLTSMQALTTGLDAPNIDLVGLKRSTLSASLFAQMVGRGTRLFQGKENCLVLDWGGNIRRHGPVDAVGAESKTFNPDADTGKVSVDSVRAKECPGCQELIAINSITCKICGHEFPREEKPKHEAEAEKSVGILSGEKVGPQQVPVVDWRFHRHEKLGMPDSVRVTFIAGISEYREWVAFEHGMTRKQAACQWWSLHGGSAPYPKTTEEALLRTDELIMPTTISIRPNKQNRKHIDIVGRSFPARAELEAAE